MRGIPTLIVAAAGTGMDRGLAVTVTGAPTTATAVGTINATVSAAATEAVIASLTAN